MTVTPGFIAHTMLVGDVLVFDVSWAILGYFRTFYLLLGCVLDFLSRLKQH